MCLALSLMGTGLLAQEVLPQVFSPNAAELGKYGKIPVSYFNGLPNISIPLTELKAKGYTLPIYLTYHAGGNKPDQHPGWVGLGWTLHAGGCINRIVNGMVDEQTSSDSVFSEATGIGYYRHMSDIQSAAWTSPEDLQPLLNNMTGHEYEPDEFQINVEGIHASFYLYGPDDIRIVSQDDIDFTVHMELNDTRLNIPILRYMHGLHAINAPLGSYFKRIVLTLNDGTRYIFGGDDNSIEFSIRQITSHSQTGDHYEADGEWMTTAQADTWMLSQVERPNGEVVAFSYRKDGQIIVRNDVHNYSEYILADNPNLYPPELKDTRRPWTIYPAIGEEGSFLSLSYRLVQPCYLSQITSLCSGETIRFHTSASVELAYPITREEFSWVFGKDNLLPQHAESENLYDLMMEQNYYMQLDSIVGPRGIIQMDYTSAQQERLKLQSVSICDSSNRVAGAYGMVYNETPLPPYNSKQTDNWGYYNGRYYGSTPYDALFAFRTVDSQKMQAEILTSLTYPTGGRTLFEYEPHHYSRIVKRFPFRLDEQEGNAGGLRISRMIDLTNQEDTALVRSFCYEEDGLPTGILSGIPQYLVRGHQYNQWESGWYCWVYNRAGSQFANFILGSELYLNQLSTTSGNHVTYSSVLEMHSDGSSIRYRYTNHDTPGCMDRSAMFYRDNVDTLLLDDRYSSIALARGLLISERMNDQTGRTVQIDSTVYQMDTLSYMYSVLRTDRFDYVVNRMQLMKLYTFFPSPVKRVRFLFSDDSIGGHQEVEEYTYDSLRRLTGMTRRVGGVTERDTITYTGNYAVQPYLGMKLRNMIAYPVEHVRFRQDTLHLERLVSAELTTWKKSDSLYVPAARYKAALGPGTAPSSFDAYDGVTKDASYGLLPEVSYTGYDSHGNIILSEDRAGLPTTYVWTQDGCHPAAIFTGSRNGFRIEAIETETNGSVWQDLNLLSSGSSIDLEFICDRSGLVEVFLDFVKAYGRTVWWRMDFGTEHQWVWPSLGPEEDLETQTLFSGNLSGGRHVFQVTAVQGNYTELAEDDEEAGEDPDSGAEHGPWTPVTYGRVPKQAMQNPVSWGSINVSFPSTEEQMEEARADDCLFEDFEDNASSTYEGFHGGKSFNGVKALDFVPYPDKYYVIDWQERQTDGTWRYRSKTIDGQGTFTAGNPGKTIDHVRVFPVGTTVESYTWDPTGNLTSRTDSRGVTESYRYDGLGRLVSVYDNEGKKVEGYQYNYKNR